jgi:hypothetical protein
MITSRSHVFRRGINFLNIVTYTISVKVIFLTNTILNIKNIANRSLRIIIVILEGSDIKAVFLI